MADALLEVRGLEVTFRSGAGWGLAGQKIHAVKGVDFSIMPGEAFALVGESGSGKSTTAKCIVGLQTPSAGSVVFAGVPLRAKRDRPQRKAIQMIFQDPFSSLNPRMTVGAALVEVLRVHHIVDGGAAARRRAAELLDMVGMPETALDQLPRAFSGGQRQRIGIARALAVDPRLLIADEPVSALDVSIQASVLLLLKRLQRELGLTLLFISHDLAVVRQLCDRVAVMAAGELVEQGTVDDVLSSPTEEFTKNLLAAATDLPPLEMSFGGRPGPGRDDGSDV
jgi:ABC-type glutathione transport system ATPase component